MDSGISTMPEARSHGGLGHREATSINLSKRPTYEMKERSLTSLSLQVGNSLSQSRKKKDLMTELDLILPKCWQTEESLQSFEVYIVFFSFLNVCNGFYRYNGYIEGVLDFCFFQPGK